MPIRVLGQSQLGTSFYVRGAATVKTEEQSPSGVGAFQSGGGLGSRLSLESSTYTPSKPSAVAPPVKTPAPLQALVIYDAAARTKQIANDGTTTSSSPAPEKAAGAVPNAAASTAKAGVTPDLTPPSGGPVGGQPPGGTTYNQFIAPPTSPNLQYQQQLAGQSLQPDLNSSINGWFQLTVATIGATYTTNANGKQTIKLSTPDATATAVYSNVPAAQNQQNQVQYGTLQSETLTYSDGTVVTYAIVKGVRTITKAPTTDGSFTSEAYLSDGATALTKNVATTDGQGNTNNTTTTVVHTANGPVTTTITWATESEKELEESTEVLDDTDILTEQLDQFFQADSNEGAASAVSYFGLGVQAAAALGTLIPHETVTITSPDGTIVMKDGVTTFSGGAITKSQTGVNNKGLFKNYTFTDGTTMDMQYNEFTGWTCTVQTADDGSRIVSWTQGPGEPIYSTETLANGAVLNTTLQPNGDSTFSGKSPDGNTFSGSVTNGVTQETTNYPDGSTQSVVQQADGSQVVTTTDSVGNVTTTSMDSSGNIIDSQLVPAATPDPQPDGPNPPDSDDDGSDDDDLFFV